MKQQIEALIAKYKSKGLLIDANLLLLFFIGSINPDYIPKFSRTKKYLIQDFETLYWLMDSFTRLLTTPNILTEVSNLATKLHGEYERLFREMFSQFIPTLGEEYRESKEIVMQKEFFKFGLTDAGMIPLGKEQFLILTDDFPLAQYLETQGIDVLNFNHIRPINWGL